MKRLIIGAIVVTALFAASRPAAALQTSDEYVVQRGDTLTEIARAFDVTLDQILEANAEITDRDVINIGQVIVIPGVVSSPQPPSDVVVPEPDATVAEDSAQIVITTEPVLEGFPVTIDGVEYLTNAFGQLRLDLPQGEHLLSAPEVYQYDADTRVVFARWSDEWAPSRPLNLSRNRNVQMALGLYVQHYIEFEFVDGLSRPINKADIDSTILMNSNGESITLSNEAGEVGESLDGVWLTRNRLRRTGGVGLLGKPNIYTLRDAFFGGVDAVQQGADEYIPSPQATWVVPMLVFPLEVEVRNFGFNRLSEARVALFSPERPSATPLVAGTVDGRATFDQIPRGDFEIEVLEGGYTPRTPVVFTGPKTEHLTVVTPGLLVVGLFVLALAVVAVWFFQRNPAIRIPILVVAGLFLATLVSLPSIGAAVVNPLSAVAEPIYDTDGAFVGMSITVANEAPLSVAQVYCQPDFELRIIGETAIWEASYESHDFHDVEMGECREHRVAPGVSHHLIAPRPGQEWSVTPDRPLPAGRYQAFVRVFAIPAEPISIDFVNGLAEDLQYVEYDPLGGDLPFTNPFED